MLIYVNHQEVESVETVPCRDRQWSSCGRVWFRVSALSGVGVIGVRECLEGRGERGEEVTN